MDGVKEGYFVPNRTSHGGTGHYVLSCALLFIHASGHGAKRCDTRRQTRLFLRGSTDCGTFKWVATNCGTIKRIATARVSSIGKVR
jgi:hypothetical protein